MMTNRYNNQQIESFAQAVLNDGYCVLPNHFSPATLNVWREAFAPLLEEHIEREGKLRNRGPSRYYVTLPFTAPFADPSIYEDEDILAIAKRPMVVIGYSRRWLFRPEVSIHIPRAALDTLSERARHLLRFNPIVESLEDKPEVEVYQSFAY